MNLLTAAGIILRPVVAVLLFVVAALIARKVTRWIPPGRLKSILTRPMHIIPKTEADRRDWWPVFWICLFVTILFVIIWRADPLSH